MKIILTVACIISLSLFSFGQKDSDYIPLPYFSPDSNDNDLAQLDSFFYNKQIIGMGESTHGTSEFTTMRHRLFKYLVEHHNFNTFFLEADYNACKRINRYIHGAEDHVDSALLEVKLWPWLTKEMTVLIDWMREYNTKHIHQLSFVGCDMQLLEDEKTELELYFGENQFVREKIEQFFSLIGNGRKSSDEVILSAQAIWSDISTSLSEDNSPDWKMMEKGVNQWFELKLRPYNNLRDSCMAENIVYYSRLNPGTKGVYFAHNMHVSRYVTSIKGLPDYKKAGTFIHEQLGSEYGVFAWTTDQGEFSVIDYGKQLKPDSVSTVARTFNRKQSIEKNFQNTNFPIAFLPSSILQTDKLYCMVSIGAIVGQPEGYPKATEYTSIKPSYFDGFFFIRNTTATELIK